jgi:predicted dithiol-disulfide oxidoreductase (DUF899 family)
VPIEKEYRFDTDEGPKTLPELFGDRSQLIVYHFMFGPAYTAGCRSARRRRIPSTAPYPT